MHLEGNAYNWYLWWKNTVRICSYNWVSFRNDLIKRFQGVGEKNFFSKITRLQQKKSFNEYTCEWEALSTRVLELTDDQQLQTYIHGLKQHIRDELELHNISTMEEAWRKERIIESKPIRIIVEQDDPKKTPLQLGYTGNPRYTVPQLREGTKPNLEARRIKEGKCKFCEDKWDPKHKCLQKKLYACEAEV